MFDLSGLVWDAEEKISAFRPRYITGVVEPDEYSASGTMTPITVDISSANADGNIIVTLPAALTYNVGDRIYLLSGIYKGYHKIYKATSTTLECLTEFTSSSSGIGFHSIENNLIALAWTMLDTTPIDSVDIEPIIKISDNSINVDITAYLQSAFTQFAIPTTNAVYDQNTGILISIVSGSYAFDGLCLYASVDPAVFNPLVDAAGDYDHPLVDSHVIFMKYHSILPFIKDDGIYNLVGYGEDVEDYIRLHTSNPDSYNYSSLCDPNAINIFFINKYGGWQNFVAVGSKTYGREIDDVKEIVTAYPIKRRISDPGNIFKKIRCMSESIPHAHLPAVLAMIESPVTFIYNDSDDTNEECIIDKKSFDYWNTNDKTITIVFDVIVSEQIYTQLR